MTLPSTGTITMADINTELGYSSTATITLNDAAVRGLAGIPSGAISLNDFHGKSNWKRPTAYSTSGTNGSVTNPTYAYDGSTSAVDTSTDAVIVHANTGAFPTTYSVTYNAFGTGTKSGTLYIACSGFATDTLVTAYSTVDVKVNGTSVGSFPEVSGGMVTFSFLGGSAIAVSLTSQNLATLSVVISCTGGRVALGDTANCELDVYDIVFV